MLKKTPVNSNPVYINEIMWSCKEEIKADDLIYRQRQWAT